jgi:hypothetical protein
MHEAPPPTYTGIGMHAEGSGSDGGGEKDGGAGECQCNSSTLAGSME